METQPAARKIVTIQQLPLDLFFQGQAIGVAYVAGRYFVFMTIPGQPYSIVSHHVSEPAARAAANHEWAEVVQMGRDFQEATAALAED